MARAGGVVSGRLSAVEADWRLCARHQDPAELGVARGDAQVAGPQLVLVSLEPEELAGFLLGATLALLFGGCVLPAVLDPKP